LFVILLLHVAEGPISLLSAPGSANRDRVKVERAKHERGALRAPDLDAGVGARTIRAGGKWASAIWREAETAGTETQGGVFGGTRWCRLLTKLSLA